ncbi:MAG: hypothetical protein GC199_11490 [Alphaproteobacteria bacterium]|nr:hypothetical protein [Alphaproteobacteria bacterium]
MRRLVIWTKPWDVIRDIGLRKGLNIVWSPDPGDDATQPIGHGSGKTTFCRLLRYCLGEDSFAPEGQRQSTWSKLPEGRVGAEVFVDGALYSVIRAFEGARLDVVATGVTLDELAQSPIAATGIDPLRKAISASIIGEAVDLMPASIGADRAWEASLAWATRDQECRFGHPLEWRDPDTDSRSPVRNKSKEDILNVVRALIGAITSAELETQSAATSADAELTHRRSSLGQLQWQLTRAYGALADPSDSGAGSKPLSDLDLEGLKSELIEQRRDALNLPDELSSDNLLEARTRRDAARGEWARLESDLRELDIRLTERTRTLSMLRSELPEANAKVWSAENPVCPICKVAIDTALAKGCGISTDTCDLSDLRAQREATKATIADEQQQIEVMRQSEAPLKQKIARAKQTFERLQGGVQSLEKTQFDRSLAMRRIDRRLDEVERCQGLSADIASAQKSVEQAETTLESIRQTLVSHRASASTSINALSALFDATMRQLVSQSVSASARLEGNRLALKVELGGDRSTAAIDSLKAVAFDLAAIILAIEGGARQPSFLVHDSPREADLGQSIYNRLFEFALWLEDHAGLNLPGFAGGSFA